MLYTIVFGSRHTLTFSATEATTAREALAITEALQGQSGAVKFITSPHEGVFGVEMLRLLAKEESEEMPVTPEVTNEGWLRPDGRSIPWRALHRRLRPF